MSDVTPTHVLFTEQQWQIEAEIQLCDPATSYGVYVVTDRTSFHPVSHIWPDHPADKGTIALGDSCFDVAGCLTGAVDLETNTLYVGTDIPVKRDTPNWAFVVVHYIAEDVQWSKGDTVILSVDKAYQQALSRGHSAGHLSSLALNKVLHSDYWRKDASRKDELGHYDFHSYAQQQSIVSEDKSTDTYRLGKTLRKRGLNTADMLANLAALTDLINQQLETWRHSGAVVVMRREGTLLTDSRYWQCDLGEGEIIEIPCGGSHIQSLAEYSALFVEFEHVSDQELVMVTHTKP
ncbi:metal-dependent hydrolase [Photobacterium indicum]|uniref:Metal-dependent hydrolase n=1 Tax=Photobacterium indicum TaxID=81447 RepID=A0A2T3LBY6_9GAMM|nr:metal-dependent hydrolase [Photobacterium indicum]PSV48849.1 metal-dependent hydrolase [Photobacterium indicum]